MVRLIDLTTYPVSEVLPVLLTDKTTAKNIVDEAGNPYVVPTDIQPRIAKALKQQTERTRRNAEVFTPAWVCCRMNNFLDEEWFGGSCPFGTLEGETWTPSAGRVPFRTPKGWQKYVWSPRLEITCGEAPFLVSRYDAATGRIIPIRERVGLLDRKLRVVGEYAETEAEWLKWAKAAFRSVYGYELQGDSLLIARINLLCTFVDYLADRWNRLATPAELREIAGIIVWNLWQMDGLTARVPAAALEKKLGKKKKTPPPPAQLEFDWIGESWGVEPSEKTDDALAVIYNWKARKEKKNVFRNLNIPGECNMKFDFVIGNPPYQEETLGENKAFAPAIYHLFLQEAYKIAEKVEMIHPARFLFNAGSTPKEWNEKMLNDSHFKVLYYEEDASKVFNCTLIRGGVTISYRDSTKTYVPIKVFTKFEELNSILKKTLPKRDSDSLMSIIYVQNKFNLDALYKDHPEFQKVIGSGGKDKRFRNNIFDKISIFSDERISEDDLDVIGVVKNKRCHKYIQRRYVDMTHKNIRSWKVLIPAANGAGTLNDVFVTPIIAPPWMCYTQTFIGIGNFKTKTEASAALSYIKTKFARCLLGILKITQHNPPETWKYVPLQDFTSKSDIDWTVSVAEIDAQLYRKYGLSEVEIQFIETNVKEME